MRIFHAASRSGLCLRAAALALVLSHLPALAGPFATDKAFDLTVNVGGTYNGANDTMTGGATSAPVGFATVDGTFSQTSGGNLSAINAAYNNNSAAVIRVGYRGLPLVLQTAANSSAVTLIIPSLGETVTFSAQATRDANVEDIKNYIKKTGGDILNRLQLALVKFSPVDPIAGNPGSLQARMVGDDFDRNFTQMASNIKGGGAGSDSVNNLIGVGMSVGSFTQGGLTNSVVTLPLSYTIRPDANPGRQITLYAPITVSDVGGAKSYGVNLGASYRLPLTDAWAVTPGLGYGISGSVDLGSAAAMLAASLTSQYTLRMGGFDLAIGNMVGIYQSSKLTTPDYSFDPKIRNTVLRNGVMASFPTQMMGRSLALEVSFVNTIYSGTDLYSNVYNEIGVTLGTNKSANVERSYLRAGLTYLAGQNDIRGLRMNIGYWF